MSNFLDKLASLTPKQRAVICDKATEFAFSGAYNQLHDKGLYLCRRCGLPLFKASSQFASGCGWPSFDVEIDGNISQQPDEDGLRTEINCSRCEAHLGHLFEGEDFTPLNKRYCVNAISLDFVASNNLQDSQELIIAGGCFWGVEYYLQKETGVIKVESGYTGGHTLEPIYQAVCAGDTGHYEAVRVIFNPDLTDYQTLLTRFFEIHDPTQAIGQGPDLGSQYQSAVFCYNNEQKKIAQDLVYRLKQNGYEVVTKLLPVQPFWPAETYHQNYYQKTKKKPYCHTPVSRFT